LGNHNLDNNLDNINNKKTVLVTGASRGIGKAIAELLYRENYRVIGTFLHSETAAKRLSDTFPGMEFIKADVSNKNDIENLKTYIEDNTDGLDILINNAGIAGQKLFTDITDDDFDKMIDVNLKSVFYTCKAFLPAMIRRKSGAIVNISSIWGVAGASCEVHYSAAKAGVIGLTKALAKEVAPSGIRVNAVAPGVIDTDMNTNMNTLDPADLDALIAETPLSRIGTPTDVAEAVLFLASEKSSFITGQVLTVDGGFIL
jgi:3-oxoacyl-[acyl-carrier protein] reductase